MSTSLGELFFRIGLTGAADVVTGLKQVAQAATDTAAKGDKADTTVRGLSQSLASLGGEARMVTMAIAGLGASFMAWSGVNLAAKYQAVTIGLTNILHSGEAAKKMMGELIQMGQETPFETADLVGFSRELLATGSSAGEAVRQLRTLANVGANMGLPVGEVGEMTRLLGSMRGRPHGGAETIQALQARGVNMAEVLAASGGPKFSGKYAQMQANQYLGSLTGAQAFDKVMTGLQKLNPTGAQSFLSVMQNMGESIRNVMLPTGELLLPVLGSLGKSLMSMANIVGKLNALTGGGAGLVAVFTGAWVGATRLVSSFRQAVVAIGQLDVAIMSLAATARASSAVSGASGAASMATPAVAGGAAAAARSGIFARLGGWLKGAFSLKGLGIGLGINWLGDMLGDKVGGGNGNFIKNVAGGAGLGAAFGPWGFAIGAIGGALKGLWENKQPAKGDDKLDKIAENTAKSADSLQSLQGRLLGGGGPRANRAIGEIEMDHALARAFLLA